VPLVRTDSGLGATSGGGTTRDVLSEAGAVCTGPSLCDAFSTAISPATSEPPASAPATATLAIAAEPSASPPAEAPPTALPVTPAAPMTLDFNPKLGTTGSAAASILRWRRTSSR